MIEPTLALHRAIGSALADDPTVIAHIDPTNIRGGTMRPEAFPCVIMGNGTTEFLGHASGSQYVARATSPFIFGLRKIVRKLPRLSASP